jgi:hypothetical protein
MSPRQEIIQLTASIRNIEDQAADLSTEAFKLREQREGLIAQMILDEKMLSGTEWEFNIDVGYILLEYNGTISDDHMEKLKQLCHNDYHSLFDLSDGIRLSFHDNEVSLTFEDPKQLMPFVKRHKIVVTGTRMIDKLSKLKREVSTLEEVCHTFGIKQ